MEKPTRYGGAIFYFTELAYPLEDKDKLTTENLYRRLSKEYKAFFEWSDEKQACLARLTDDSSLSTETVDIIKRSSSLNCFTAIKLLKSEKK